MSFERIPLSKRAADIDLISIAQARGIKMRHAGGNKNTGLCPFHNEKTPSFYIYDNQEKQTFHCFGCGEYGDALDFIMKYHSTDIKGALAHLSDNQTNPAPQSDNGQKNGVRGKSSYDDYRNKKALERIHKILQRSTPAENTLVETYLRNRGIDIKEIGGIPPSLRCAVVDYWHVKAGCSDPIKLGSFPAMIAPISNNIDKTIGLHITYIDPKTGNKLILPAFNSEVKPPPSKKIIGKMSGGAICLKPASSSLLVTEGIENALTAMMLWSDYSAWTSVSLGNMQKIHIPEFVNNIRLIADNDMKQGDNRNNPRDMIYKSAQKWKAEQYGRKVSICWPPEGEDLNDSFLKQKAGCND